MKLVCPPFKGENKGHYSAGVISKGMLYVSGQLSIDPDTREVMTWNPLIAQNKGQ